MIGPLVYLVTSCDYTISNNDLALDMKSAVSIPFCGGIKNVRVPISCPLPFINFARNFVDIFIYGNPRFERFFLKTIWLEGT